MPIQLSNALDSWTNSKPPKLVEKGVSEALKTLPDNPSVATDFDKISRSWRMPGKPWRQPCLTRRFAARRKRCSASPRSFVS